MNPRQRVVALAAAALLLLSFAAQALAAPAPATPTYSATLTADRKCTLSVNVTWKNAPAVAKVNVSLWETGYLNPNIGIQDFVVSYEWPSTSPNTGVLKGKVLTFTFGPVVRDTTSHQWRAIVQFYDANGAAITEIVPELTTNCYFAPPS